MFANMKKFTISATRLASKNGLYNDKKGKITNDVWIGVQRVHTTTLRPNYAATATLPIPNNIDPAETTRFSPNRARDISGTVILSQHSQTLSMPRIDITTDNSSKNMVRTENIINFGQQDPHVQSYDCFGAVSLNSAMQSNVPTPFGGMHRFSHLNMPGGQWSQEGKFMSANLHSSHYTTLRKNARSGWVAYDQDATIDKKDLAASINWSGTFLQSRRNYCKKVEAISTPKALSKKDKLKQAFKDYGATVIIFHVAISLLSLGGFYLLVSGGVDVMSILERLGLESTNKIAANTSTFVMAYAIHKVFAPFRISITLGATPFIVRYMRSKGYMKPSK